MQRTITVKGTGTAKATPDLIRIVISLESQDFDYGFTMRLAERKIEALKESLASVGFDKKALKTLNFNVRTDYKSEKDSNDNYKRVFNGYICSHDLKLEFDFDTKQLANTLNAIATCVADPELSIAFTLKDPAAISTELLRNATTNAREKAEILCSAANVKLGELQTINYNWSELNVVSHTEYPLADRFMRELSDCNIDIEPDDISLSDTATFVWEIQ